MGIAGRPVSEKNAIWRVIAAIGTKYDRDQSRGVLLDHRVSLMKNWLGVFCGVGYDLQIFVLLSGNRCVASDRATNGPDCNSHRK